LAPVMHTTAARGPVGRALTVRLQGLASDLKEGTVILTGIRG